MDRQIDGWTDACQNITFPRTTYTGGNETRSSDWLVNSSVMVKSLSSKRCTDQYVEIRVVL